VDITQHRSYTISLNYEELKELFNDLDARADEYTLLPTTRELRTKIEKVIDP